VVGLNSDIVVGQLPYGGSRVRHGEGCNATRNLAAARNFL